MLQSYAAIYKQGHLEWLDDAPTQENVQVIVTFVQTSQNRPLTQAQQILQRAWGCVEKPCKVESIDDDIVQMRGEWDGNERQNGF